MVKVTSTKGLNSEIMHRISVGSIVPLSNRSSNAIPAVYVQDQWSICTKEQISTLLSSHNIAADGQTISVLQAVDSAKPKIDQFRQWLLESAEDRGPIQCKQRIMECGLFDALYKEPTPDGFMGVSCGRANQLHLTKNRKTNAAIGLHIDNWDNHTVSARRHSRNRMSLNIGKEHRFLMFIALEAFEIEALLLKHSLYGNYTYEATPNHAELVWRYCKLFPHTPVFRVEIRPYEAYIAPTENIIHDGSTLSTTSVDIHMTWLGKFHRSLWISE